MSEAHDLPPAASEYRGRRRAQPAGPPPPADPAPLTRRQLLEIRRAAEAEAAAARDRVEPEADRPPEPPADQPPAQPAAQPAEQPGEPSGEQPGQPSGQERADRPPARPVLEVQLPTRRELAQQRRAESHRRPHPRVARRTAVAVGAATVTVVAVTAGRALGVPPAPASVAAELPRGIAATQQLSPKVSSATVITALRIGESSAIPLGVRASRSSNRPVLPGCTGVVTDTHYANGEVPKDELCALGFAPGHHLRADAAVALARLNIAYRARFGHDVCLTDSYRSVAAQESLAARKPGLAARPGTSEHGMGLAVDFCGGVEAYRSTAYDWMRANAPAFGWQNPDWAIPPSSREEPWHWEYVVGEARTTTAS